MPSPGEYFPNNPREAELADRIWVISETLPGNWELHSTNDWFANAWWPWVAKRIIYARDWVTHYRELDEKGGVNSLNAALGGTDFTAEEIGNVEHFYVSAMISTIGGPVGGPVMATAGNAVWELVVGPIRIAWRKKGWPGMENLKHNWKQFTGPDLEGINFGSDYEFWNAVEIATGVKPTPRAKRKPELYFVETGDSLSKISQDRYEDMSLWPVLYDANKELIGNNPNLIVPKQPLLIPYLFDVPKAQVEAAKQRHAQWTP